MQPRVVRGDSCCGGEADAAPFADRVEIGRRRRLLVHRVVWACSAVLALAALVLWVADMAPWSVLADRLAWAASVWAAGLVLGWVREALTARSPDWRLAAGVVAVVIGIVWQPLVPALVAVALLTERVVRPPRTQAHSTDRRLSPVAGHQG